MIQHNNASYFAYWGKAKPAADSDLTAIQRYHLLAYHSLDVAAVGHILLDPYLPLCQKLAKQLKVEPQWLQQWFCFCLALHDLGKFSRSFQNIVPNLSSDLVVVAENMAYSERHDSLGFALWQRDIGPLWLAQHANLSLPIKIAKLIRFVKPWLAVVTGHHGVPPKQNIQPDNYFLSQDKQAAALFCEHAGDLLLKHFDFSILADKTLYQKMLKCSWQLAGVAVLADWLGSNQSIFHYNTTPIELATYWQKSATINAAKAIEYAALKPAAVNPFNSIKQLFDFIEDKTPLQQHAVSVDIGDEPQLMILEDVTGAGKTEAAMVLVHRLMHQQLADGVYVALPTMATANGMYRRMAKAYRGLYQSAQMPSLVLAHGARQYSQQFIDSVVLPGQQPQDCNYQQDLSATAFCSAWLADSHKKALLADVGVGTLDQALLAVLPARHQSLRMLGLSNKVLLVDEVHAYDAYMQQLLETLIKAHAMQGGSVILLSATMPLNMRRAFVNAYCDGRGQSQSQLTAASYPLVTQVPNAAALETVVATRREVERQVQVKILDNEQTVMDKICQAVAQGKCVCWVRNTVKTAKQAYDQLSGLLPAQQLSLFHSRFAMADRQRIENQTLDCFGKDSTDAQRSGQVLVATQVVEQSLDLDFDLMISDLAPIDLIIQRAGRVHRHVRDQRGNRLAQGQQDQRGGPLLYVLSPSTEKAPSENWLKALLPANGFIYPNIGQLWLTAKLLSEHQGFSMPDDARTLIEGVYGDQAKANIPDVLQDDSFLAQQESKIKRGMANLNGLLLDKGYSRESGENSSGWDEDVNTPTRLADDSVKVVLATVKGCELVPYAQNTDFDWPMSTINLRLADWQKAEKFIDAKWHSIIATMKAQDSSLRWVEILPLEDKVAEYYGADQGWLI